MLNEGSGGIDLEKVSEKVFNVPKLRDVSKEERREQSPVQQAAPFVQML